MQVEQQQQPQIGPPSPSPTTPTPTVNAPALMVQSPATSFSKPFHILETLTPDERFTLTEAHLGLISIQRSLERLDYLEKLSQERVRQLFSNIRISLNDKEKKMADEVAMLSAKSRQTLESEKAKRSALKSQLTAIAIANTSPSGANTAELSKEIEKILSKEAKSAPPFDDRQLLPFQIDDPQLLVTMANMRMKNVLADQQNHPPSIVVGIPLHDNEEGRRTISKLQPFNPLTYSQGNLSSPHFAVQGSTTAFTPSHHENSSKRKLSSPSESSKRKRRNFRVQPPCELELRKVIQKGCQNRFTEEEILKSVVVPKPKGDGQCYFILPCSVHGLTRHSKRSDRDRSLKCLECMSVNTWLWAQKQKQIETENGGKPKEETPETSTATQALVDAMPLAQPDHEDMLSDSESE